MGIQIRFLAGDRLRWGFVLSLGVATMSCQGGAPNDGASETASTEAPRFDDAMLMEHIEALSSDEFGGRAPGSDGEQKTIAYLQNQFDAYGLSPGNPDGSWVQEVPLVGITAVSTEVRVGDEPLEPSTDVVAWTKRVVESVETRGELVFVGYGVRAPEIDWDDYKDVDVSGKILVMLVNDPPVEGLFGGEAMTYYGRWTYKYEIAAEMGAAGAFIVHETAPAGYGWEVVSGS